MSKGRVGKDIAVREDLHRLYDRVEESSWLDLRSELGWLDDKVAGDFNRTLC